MNKKKVPNYRLHFNWDAKGQWAVYEVYKSPISGEWLSFVGNTPVL